MGICHLIVLKIIKTMYHHEEREREFENYYLCMIKGRGREIGREPWGERESLWFP